MKRVLIIASVLVLACATPIFAQQATRKHAQHAPTEQKHFSAEDESVKKPIALPADVERLMLKDEMVQRILESEERPSDKLPNSWYSASMIHLSTATKRDIIVVGNQPLSGGNTGTFWVFRATQNGYELVLTTPAHDLEIRPTRHNGYRDIELTAMTAVTFSNITLRFDGKRYVEFRSTSRNIE